MHCVYLCDALSSLDVFELNLGYLYGIPYWDGTLQKVHYFRVMHLHQVTLLF